MRVAHFLGRAENAPILGQLDLQIPLDYVISARPQYVVSSRDRDLASLEISADHVDHQTHVLDHVEIWWLIRTVPEANRGECSTWQENPRYPLDVHLGSDLFLGFPPRLFS